MVYIAGWILVVWLFILRWQKARFVNARVQPPVGRRTIIPIAIPFQERGEQPQEKDNSPNIIRDIELSGNTKLALMPGGQKLDTSEEERGIRGGSAAAELGAEPLPRSVLRRSPNPDLANALPLLTKSYSI